MSALHWLVDKENLGDKIAFPLKLDPELSGVASSNSEPVFSKSYWLALGPMDIFLLETRFVQDNSGKEAETQGGFTP